MSSCCKVNNKESCVGDLGLIWLWNNENLNYHVDFIEGVWVFWWQKKMWLWGSWCVFGTKCDYRMIWWLNYPHMPIVLCEKKNGFVGINEQSETQAYS